MSTHRGYGRFGHLPTWDLLIATIPHRHATLLELLAGLDAQIEYPLSCLMYGVGAILYRDNLTAEYGDKTQALLEASKAEYVSCIDDDDLLAPRAVARITAALRTHPDYVGFTVAWTRDGVPQAPVEHSLRHPPWHNSPEQLLRSVMQFNPIRRDVALEGKWHGGYEAERRWQEGVLASGRCKTEMFLDDPPVYLYRERTGDTFKTPRQPMAAADIPPLPEYPWLRVLTAPGSC
jgi:hypothetical protein